MNLIIEQGNTATKVAIYNKGIIEASYTYNEFDSSVLKPLFLIHHLTHGIMSSVIEPDHELIDFLKQTFTNFIWVDENTSVPVSVKYKTPATLGKDRLAAVVGANSLMPEKDILVIDTGTAITYDIIESSGAYLGGNISPGMSTRFKALNHFTKKLPLVTETEDIPLIGFDTESAIQAGVVNGIIYEMDGIISALKLKYPNLFVFLTGGHSFYFERRLKNIIFADINLVMTGLNRILEYNVEN